MGIGFVLLLLLILALGIAGGCSLLLAALTRKFTSRAGPKDRKRALMAVVVLPPVCVVCGLVGFGVYAAWCDSRGVDPGIGDSWFVPLGSGYRLAFVDIADQAFLESPTKEQFDLYTRGVGFDSQTIYFEAADHTYQLIEKANGRVSHGLSESALAIRLQSLGQPPASLRPPSQIYDELRWSAQDLLAVPIVFGVPMVLSARVGYYVWTVRKRSSQ